MLPNLLNVFVSIKRRIDYNRASFDVLGNPVYGDSSTWDTIFTHMPVRFAFPAKELQFANTGERIIPSGVMYYNPEHKLLPMDRVLTPDGIEYVITDISVGIRIGAIIDHYEAKLILP